MENYEKSEKMSMVLQLKKFFGRMVNKLKQWLMTLQFQDTILLTPTVSGFGQHYPLLRPRITNFIARQMMIILI